MPAQTLGSRLAPHPLPDGEGNEQADSINFGKTLILHFACHLSLQGPGNAVHTSRSTLRPQKQGDRIDTVSPCFSVIVI